MSAAYNAFQVALLSIMLIRNLKKQKSLNEIKNIFISKNGVGVDIIETFLNKTSYAMIPTYP